MQFHFGEDKNEWLKENRNVSFEEVIGLIRLGEILDIIDHTNQRSYPNQKICMIYLSNYCYAVPFVQESETSVFLKTIIPDRKLNKRYRGGQNG